MTALGAVAVGKGARATGLRVAAVIAPFLSTVATSLVTLAVLKRDGSCSTN